MLFLILLQYIMIAPNSRARKGGSMEEFEGKRRGMMTTGDWCNPVSNMLHHVQERLSGDWAKRFENGGSVLGRHPDRGYTGGWCSHML